MTTNYKLKQLEQSIANFEIHEISIQNLWGIQVGLIIIDEDGIQLIQADSISDQCGISTCDIHMQS